MVALYILITLYNKNKFLNINQLHKEMYNKMKIHCWFRKNNYFLKIVNLMKTTKIQKQIMSAIFPLWEFE